MAGGIRQVSVAVAVLFVAGALAGCADSETPSRPDPDDGSGPTVSAAAHLPKARSSAVQWDAAASLHGVLGAMATDPSQALNQSDPDERALLQNLTGEPDAEPWDGTHQAWLYSFVNADRTRAFNIVLDAAGQETMRWEEARQPRNLADSPFGSSVISGWKIDSGEAMDTLMASNATLRECAARDAAAGGLTLSANNESAPLWRLNLWVPDMDAGAWGVHAASGNYLGPLVDYSCLRPPREGAWFGEFNLTPLAPEQRHPFEINHRGHQQVALYARYKSSPTERRVNMTLIDPSGAEHYPVGLDWSCPEDQACGKFSAFSDPKPGEYEVRLRLENTAILEYSLYWCARGTPSDADANHACETAGLTEP